MLSIVLIAITTAFAFKGHDPAARAKKQTEWMKKELSLTDDQTSKVENINLKYAQKKKEIIEQMHKQMSALDKDKTSDLQGVLNKEQLSKYESKKAEMKEKRKDHGKKHHDRKNDNKKEENK